MSWQDLLKRDLLNVKKGKEEADEDTRFVQDCLDVINDNMSKDEVAVHLQERGLGYFAGLVITGNYDRMAQYEQEAKADS